MEALRPKIIEGRLPEADLHRAVDDLRLPARFFGELLAHLEGTGVAVVSEADGEDADSGFNRDGLSVFLERARQHRLLTASQERALAATIAEGRLAQDWLVSGRVPPEAVADLRRKVTAGEEATNEFVYCNMRLVVSIASRLQHRGLELEDLIQEGQFGLATAVRKFDPDLGHKFSTYATWWIRQSIHRAIADRGQAIRLPVHMYERVVRHAVMVSRLHAQLGRLPTDEELIRALEWSPRELVEVRRASRMRPESLDKPIGDRLRAGDVIADPDSLTPEEAAVTADLCRQVRSMLAELRPRDREVIELRFGLADGRVHTLEEIGERFSLTRERIRQLEVKALNSLRSAARRHGLVELILPETSEVE